MNKSLKVLIAQGVAAHVQAIQTNNAAQVTVFRALDTKGERFLTFQVECPMRIGELRFSDWLDV